MRTTDTHVYFWKAKLGQWTMATMTDWWGVTYNCAEQYMMYQKAMLFADKETAAKILAEPDPSKQQDLGRTVKGFNQATWDNVREDVVFTGNMLKFTQHPDLLVILLNTGDRVLVEASPYDKVWGVGLGAKDPRIEDERNWTGLNLLGKTLMRVRQNIIRKLKDAGSYEVNFS